MTARHHTASDQPPPSRATSPVTVLDLHQDLLSYTDSGRSAQTSLRRLESSSIRVLNTTAFPGTFDTWDRYDPAARANHAGIEERLRRYRDICATGRWQIMTSRTDLDRCLRAASRRRGLILAVEGLDPIPARATLDRWWQVGLRTIGPVWFFSNQFGGSSNDPRPGLSRKGRELLRWAAGRPLVLDLAHVNVRTFWQVAEATDGPLVVTHTAAAALVSHHRNLDDDQLRAISGRSGLVGLAFVPGFLREGARAGMADAADHLDHLRSVAGSEVVAIGSDLGGTRATVRGLASVCAIDRLSAELERRGWPRAQRSALFSGNARRVLGDILDR